MKKFLSLFLVLSLCISSVACSKNTSGHGKSDNLLELMERETTVETESTEPTETIHVAYAGPMEISSDDQILFIRETWNYAWGYNYALTIYTADGHSYYRDFSMEGPTDFSIEDAFSIPMTGGTTPYDASEMSDMVDLFNSIMNNNQEEYVMAYDMGMTSLYGVVYNDDGSHSFVALGSYGDWCYEPLDPNALELCNRLGLNW